MDMQQLRRQIDQVDDALIEQFIRRMEISDRIADYKKENQIPVFDPVREQEKLKAVAEKVPSDLQSAVKVLYSLLFELSRSYQSSKNAAQTALFRQISDAIDQTPPLFPQQIAVACLGQSDERLQQRLRRISKNADALYFGNVEAVLAAVAQNMCPYGLLPVSGAKIYDNISTCGFYILRSFKIHSPDGDDQPYVLFGKNLEIYPGADRTTLMLILPNKPGSLYRVLARLYTLGLNIAKLESRPVHGDDFKIRFYLDLETSVYAPEFVRLMCELDDLCEDFRYLGSYSEVV